MKKNIKFKVNWKRHVKLIYLFAAVLTFSIGGLIAFNGNLVSNPLLIALGFGGLAGSLRFFILWRRQGDIRHTGNKRESDGEVSKPPNSLNLYPNFIEFNYVEEPLGQAQKCLNDGKYYFVHNQHGLDVDALEEFRLPDDDDSERYYDPSEFANPVTMPSNKRYFVWSASTMQKISVGVMALIIGLLIFGLIAAGG